MKRVAFTMLIGLIAFVSAGLLARSLGKHQYERYVGAKGWTLKQDVRDVYPDKEPRVTQRRIEYFAADNRHRSDRYIVNVDGSEECQSSFIYDPNLGLFQEDRKYRQLVYEEDHMVHLENVDIDIARALPNYVGDQEILGYNCAVFRITLPDGDVYERYEAYKLGRYPIQRIAYKAKATHITEPTSIELGPPSEAEFMHNDQWPINFGRFEDRIQSYSTTAAETKEPRAIEEVNRMRQQLQQAKQRLASRGYAMK